MDNVYIDALQVWVIDEDTYAAIGTKTSNALSDAAVKIYDSEQPPVWTQSALLLNAWKGKKIRVMFRNNTLDEMAVGLDDIYVALEEPTDPSELTGIRNLNVVQEGFHVNLSWELNTEEEVEVEGLAGYNIYRDGKLINTTTAITFRDEYVIESGVYDYCVAAKYGTVGFESVKSCQNISFEEVQPANSLFTTFEEFSKEGLGEGWSAGGTAAWEFSDSFHYSMYGEPEPYADGSYAWFDAMLSPNGTYANLITPYIKPAADKSTLSFELKNGFISDAAISILELFVGEMPRFNPAKAPEFQVLVSEDQGRTWKKIYDIATGFPAYPHVDFNATVTIDLANYIDKPIFINFYAKSKENRSYLAIDNVELVGDAGPCQPATNLMAVQGNDTNTVTITWDKVDTQASVEPGSDENPWVTHFEGGFPYTWEVENNTYQTALGSNHIAWQPAENWYNYSYGPAPAESFIFFNSINFANTRTAAHLLTHEFSVTENAKTMTVKLQQRRMSSSYTGKGEAIYLDYSEDGGATWAEGTVNILASIAGYNSTDTEIIEQEHDLSAYVGKKIKVRLRGKSDWGATLTLLYSIGLPAGPPPQPTYTLSRNGEVIAEGLINNSYIDSEVDATGTYIYALTTTVVDADCASAPAYTILDFTSVCDLYPVSNVMAVQDDKFITITWENPKRASSAFGENFENGGAIPTGWKQEQVSGTMAWTFAKSHVANYPGAAANGEYFALFADRSGAKNVAKLISPKFNIAEVENATLAFKVFAHNWASDYTGLKVYYKNSEAGSWNLITTYTHKVYSSWTEIEIALPNPTSTYWIAFEAIGAFGYGLGIDDVKLVASYDVPKNIYRNGELLTSEAVGTTYVDKLRTSGTYEYCINMPIENCETVPVCTSITAQIGEINTTFPDNNVPYQWEVVKSNDTRLWEFADTYAERDMEDAYVPFADGDGTFVWFNNPYWNRNDYACLISPYFEPIQDEATLAFDLAAIKTAFSDKAGQGAKLFVDIQLLSDPKKWILGTENYLAAIPGYNKASHNLDLVSIDLSEYINRDIRVRFRAVADHGSFITAMDNVRLTDKAAIYDCRLNPVTDLMTTVESDGVILTWDMATSAPANAPDDNIKKISEEKLNAQIQGRNQATDFKAIFAPTTDRGEKSTWITRFENGIPFGWTTENNTYQGNYSQTAWRHHSTWDIENYGNKPASSFMWFDAFNFQIADPAAHLITHEFEVSNDAKTMSIEIQEIFMNSNYASTGEAIYIDYSTDSGNTWTNGTTNILASLEGYNSEDTPVTEQTYDLSSYVGKKVKVRFRGVSDYGGCIAVLYSVALPSGPVGGGSEPEVIYTQSFEEDCDWLIIDNSTTTEWNMEIGGLQGIPAHSGMYYLTSGFDDINSRNAWAISPAVNLEAGKEYTVSIYFFGQGWPAGEGEERFKLTVGAERTEAGQTTVIVDKSLTATSWTLVSGTYTPVVSGEYYFGLNHCSVADRNGVGFDDFSISTIVEGEGDGFGENDNPLTYTITRNGAIIVEGLTRVSYKDEGVTNDMLGTYEYAVITVKGMCTSDEAIAIVNIKADCENNKVSSFIAKVDNEIVNLEWTAFNNEVTQAYDVYENGVKIAENITTTSLGVVPTTTGNIDYCVVAISNNCISEPNCSNVYYAPTNISKVNGKVAVYPTVTTGKVMVDTPADANVKVTDASGRVLETAESTGKLELNLNYNNGVYLIIVEAEGSVSTHKVIIKK